ncbi:helix-turn-helix domain-containing protein [Pseudonocardia sp. MH-G8]|uniref:helix-turn-helix domain-containing protein n=1 Tax=Pseudonocardia sp. MH-G8 TaxID=1854588 RepID=UPI0018E998C6|nr:helix-turn-helix domain-containing protein [Pseudonocardia sp. MH-G8]
MDGVGAVVTTGIYCVPSCAARPRPENVRAFPTAAGAEVAGFRACHRCRPYRGEQQAPGAASPLVCRAVDLIASGGLDEGGEAALAARLGMSARHLRRVFRDQVGATPDQLARSRRAHFARRLLDDTDLSITDVAFAAGFGSVRQFNREMAGTFHAPPRELRGRRRRADRLVADGGLALRLPLSPAVDLDRRLQHLAATAIPGVSSGTAGGYRRTVRHDGDPGVIEICGGGRGHALLVVHLPRLEGLIHLVGSVRGLVEGRADGFEEYVRAVVARRVDPADVQGAVGHIAERYGAPVPGLLPLGLSRTFPEPDDLGADGLDRAVAEAVRCRAVRSADEGQRDVRR